MGRLLAARLRRSVDGGRGHHVRGEGHVRRRWEPEAVDARADARQVGFVRPISCPPITDRNRGAVFRFEGPKSDRRHHYHYLRPFARFQPAHYPFRSASSLPVAPFPSAARPCPCPWPCALRNLDLLLHGHFRIREGYDQTRGKNSRKTDRDDSSWKFQCETLIFGM